MLIAYIMYRSQSDETYIPKSYDVDELQWMPSELTGSVADSLADDISVVMRNRVKIGYSMQVKVNSFFF